MIMIRTASRAQSSIYTAGKVMMRGGVGTLEGFASFDGLAALRSFPPPHVQPQPPISRGPDAAPPESRNNVLYHGRRGPTTADDNALPPWQH